MCIYIYIYIQLKNTKRTRLPSHGEAATQFSSVTPICGPAAQVHVARPHPVQSRCPRRHHLATHYWIRLLCREPRALGKGLKTLGKVFAESLPRGSRQRALDKEALGKEFFAESHMAGSRQNPRHRRGTSMLTSSLPRAVLAGSRQRLFIFLKKKSLPRACQAGSRQRRAFPRAVLAGSRQRLF